MSAAVPWSRMLLEQVLLFNLPGQANTQWHSDSVLTNDYNAAVLRALLHYLGCKGTRQFLGLSSTTPFFVLGSGNGANVATCFAMRYVRLGAPWLAIPLPGTQRGT